MSVIIRKINPRLRSKKQLAHVPSQGRHREVAQPRVTLDVQASESAPSVDGQRVASAESVNHEGTSDGQKQEGGLNASL